MTPYIHVWMICSAIMIVIMVIYNVITVKSVTIIVYVIITIIMSIDHNLNLLS